MTVYVKGLAPPEIRKRLHEQYVAVADAQKMTVRCTTCRWKWTGSVGEGKRRFQEHLSGHWHNHRRRT